MWHETSCVMWVTQQTRVECTVVSEANDLLGCALRTLVYIVVNVEFIVNRAELLCVTLCSRSDSTLESQIAKLRGGLVLLQRSRRALVRRAPHAFLSCLSEAAILMQCDMMYICMRA